jgi:hypothetical protein
MMRLGVPGRAQSHQHLWGTAGNRIIHFWGALGGPNRIGPIGALRLGLWAVGGPNRIGTFGASGGPNRIGTCWALGGPNRTGTFGALGGPSRIGTFGAPNRIGTFGAFGGPNRIGTFGALAAGGFRLGPKVLIRSGPGSRGTQSDCAMLGPFGLMRWGPSGSKRAAAVGPGCAPKC